MAEGFDETTARGKGAGSGRRAGAARRRGRGAGGGGAPADGAGLRRGDAGAGPAASPRTATGASAVPAGGGAPARGRGGFRHAGLCARAPIREAAHRRGFAEMRVLTDWDAIAGSELARLCRPVKVTYAAKGFGATLVLLAAGAAAPEVQMLGPRIVERVNAHYGYRAVSRVKVVQTDRSLGRAAASRGRDRPEGGEGGDGRASAAISPEIETRAAGAARRAESPALRAALERLALNVLARKAGGDGA